MIDGLAHPLEALLDARLIVRVPASRPIDYASGYWAQIEAERRQQLSDQLLPYWLHIAGAYEAALNSPVSGDNDVVKISAKIEHWPQTFDGQQYTQRPSRLCLKTKLAAPITTDSFM